MKIKTTGRNKTQNRTYAVDSAYKIVIRSKDTSTEYKWSCYKRNQTSPKISALGNYNQNRFISN